MLKIKLFHNFNGKLIELIIILIIEAIVYGMFLKNNVYNFPTIDKNVLEVLYL